MTLSDPPLAPATRPPRRRPNALLVVRRVHLYAGLLLVPWVLLYGVTAFLFNHPSVMNDLDRQVLSPADLAGTPLVGGLDANVVAASVVDALRADGLDVQRGTDAARYTRSLRLEADPDGVGRQTLFVELDGGSGTLYTRPAGDDEGASPLDRGRLDVALGDADPREAWRQGGRALMAARTGVELSPDDVSIRSGPTVAFDVVADGRPYRAHYDVGRGRLEAEPLDEAGAFDARDTLLRLHTAHVYPSEGGVRWVWAVLVDVMAVAMVGWAVSGLVMWWQIKRTRRLGTWLVGASLVAAALIGAAMHAALAA